MFIENEDNFVLGRGHESDVRISDISVSRTHAKITFKDKKFILEDTGSKFGTLVLAKDSVEITSRQVILQIGRTLLSLTDVKEGIMSKKTSSSMTTATVEDKKENKLENKYGCNNKFENILIFIFI